MDILTEIEEIAENYGMDRHNDLGHGQHQWYSEDDDYMIHLSHADDPERAKIMICYASDGEQAVQFDRHSGPYGNLVIGVHDHDNCEFVFDRQAIEYLDWFLKHRFRSN